MVGELAPGFLVASPSLLDTNFQRAVVLLTAHRDEGSLGFVVNRPASMDFEQVAGELGLIEQGIELPKVPVLNGGPVAPESGWVVYDPRNSDFEDDEGVLEVTDKLHISTSRELLNRMAKDSSLERHVLLLGYAGWGPGQLQDEIRQGAWIPVDIDEAVVYDTAPDDRWNAALETLGIDPLHVVGTPRAEA